MTDSEGLTVFGALPRLPMQRWKLPQARNGPCPPTPQLDSAEGQQALTLQGTLPAKGRRVSLALRARILQTGRRPWEMTGPAWGCGRGLGRGAGGSGSSGPAGPSHPAASGGPGWGGEMRGLVAPSGAESCPHAPPSPPLRLSGSRKRTPGTSRCASAVVHACSRSPRGAGMDPARGFLALHGELGGAWGNIQDLIPLGSRTHSRFGSHFEGQGGLGSGLPTRVPYARAWFHSRTHQGDSGREPGLLSVRGLQAGAGKIQAGQNW